jgi:hypothetical protein
MANEQTGGLPIADITKLNLYNMPSDKQQELLDANEAGLAALQQRYAQPNWFNVAAGFAKPQLGGFFASLGSAAQAMGENLEKQRANELPVAQMRAQNAIMRNQFGQNQKAADLERQRLIDKKPVTPQHVAELMNTAPDSPQAKAAKAELDAMTQNRQLESSEVSSRASQYGQALKEIELKNMNHGYKTIEELNAALQTAKEMYGPKAPSEVRLPTENPITKGQGTTSVAGADTVAGAGVVGAGAAGAAAAGAAANPPVDPTKPVTFFGEKLTDAGLKEFEDAAKKDPATKMALQDYYRQHPPAWSHKEYPVPKPAVPADLDIEAKNAYLKENTKASTEYVNNIAALANDTSTVNRRENLINIVDQLHRPTVQTWLARSDPASVASIVRSALTSESMPAFISKMVAGTNNLLPTDSKTMVSDVQKYIQNLASEQQYANQMQKAQTNKQLALEQFSAIGPETQPKAAILKAAEELHKIQRLSSLPYILEPYAAAGHPVSSMLNSDRLAEYNKHWSALHRALPQFAERLELPTALTVPDAYKPGFNYESLKPKEAQ